MKLEVGMYARTINGKIWIIISQKAISGHRKDIIKASHNIMDLIEVGDYVNGFPVIHKENKQLKDLIDTILNFSFFKEECPLNFGFENNTNEDKSQSIFYEDQWCENNCDDNYKDCWLKYFKKLQELKQGSDDNGQ